MKSLSNKLSVKLVFFIFNHPVLANIQLFKWATKNRYLEKKAPSLSVFNKRFKLNFIHFGFRYF